MILTWYVDHSNVVLTILFSSMHKYVYLPKVASTKNCYHLEVLEAKGFSAGSKRDNSQIIDSAHNVRHVINSFSAFVK